MQFLIGIENNIEGRSMAWALEYPGCFAYGEDEDAAILAMPHAILDYALWVENRSQGQRQIDIGAIELCIADTWNVYHVNKDLEPVEDGYEVNAWFQLDWKPLTPEDVEFARQLLSWGREDLLAVVSGLGKGALELGRPGERWSIAGILKHVAMGEWWYLDRLGLAPARSKLPRDLFERLEFVRARLLESLPGLVDSRQVIGVDGEFWSPRKLLRRAVYHERDHTIHIRKLR